MHCITAGRDLDIKISEIEGEKCRMDIVPQDGTFQSHHLFRLLARPLGVLFVILICHSLF
jgi:hypothetical protein